MYIAPPSPCKHITGLSGDAIAAPVARGSPCPIDPPVKASQSKGFAFHACGVTKKPEVAASSATIASSGSNPVNRAPRFSGFNSPDVGISILPSGIKCLSMFDPLNMSFRAFKAYFPS